jgi:hypothetical protein
MHYLQFLKSLHTALTPRTYLEIGIRKGASFTLSQARSIGIDPAYAVEFPLPADHVLFRAKSDDVFAGAEIGQALGAARVDLAFIDGWHNFEFALRDFMNTEALCHPGSVIVFDDVRPRNETEAVRKPHGGAWTGDVWKIIPCLAAWRPDLRLTCVGTLPTGLLMVEALDPASPVLRRDYARIEAEFLAPGFPLMPDATTLGLFVPPAQALADLRARRGIAV